MWKSKEGYPSLFFCINIRKGEIIMRIEHLELTDSTNEVLKRKRHKQEYDIVYADNQTASKGRRGNKWISDKGAALFSFLVKDNDYGEKTSLLVGYAVYKILDGILESDKLTFKWPNDIHYNGRKISGILIEKCEDFLIVGIGINVNNTDFGVYGETALSLKLITGKEYDVKNIIVKTVEETKQRLEKIAEEWEAVIDFLNEKHSLNNKLVENNQKEQYEVIKINYDGSLKVKKDGEKNYTDIYSDEIKGIKIKN